LLGELLPRVSAIFGADTSSVLLTDGSGEQLVVRAAIGLPNGVVQQVRVTIGEGFAGRVAAERRTLVVDDLPTSDVVSPNMRRAGMRSLAGAPLLMEGRLIGVLHVGTLRARAFAENDLLMLQLIGDRVALVIENARLQREAAAAAAALEADRLKTDLLNTVSHELRTPLAAIKGFTTTIQSFYDRISEEEMREFLGEIDSASDRLQELIENLLQLSRMESGTFQLTMEPVQLRGMLEWAAEESRRRHAEREITLEMVSEPPEIRGDGRRLGQVVANLIENAVKYSPDGGVVEVRAGASTTGAWFSVTDHGLGIAPEHVDQIFERFYRVDTPRTREIGGTGLGLAICKRIIEEHGGRIEVASTEGMGSTFTVILPPAQ
jgi:signal transduction histidine kinase